MSHTRAPDAFFDDLETVVYGCHAESREQVKQAFEEAGLYTFTFAEYFLDEPVTKTTASNNKVNERKIYFPFLPWAASLLLFRVETASKGVEIETKFLAKTSDWKKKLRKSCGSGTDLAKWESQVDRITKFWDDTSSWQFEEVIDDAANIKKERGAATKLSNADDPLNEGLVSYDIQLHLWSRSDISKQKPVIIMRVPIASEHCYYGHLVVVYQEQEEIVLSDDKSTVVAYKDGKGKTPICVKLRAILEHLAKDRYAPTHVSKWEKKLKVEIKKAEKPRSSATISAFSSRKPSPSPVSLGWIDSTNSIERAFGCLWSNRKKKWDENNKKAIPTIKNSIILDEYHIASPAMIKQVRAVVHGAALMKAVGSATKSLPSALVFGEAGSGKDQMARLIATLTNDFWYVEPTTQNMAAVKPALLAVPLMFGIKHNSLDVPGIFRFKGSSKDGKVPAPQVLILDELNSLDYDMQGSLLRLLENNEAVPMFSTDGPAPVNALVVGVVNEDPERVTREEELRLLDGAREFLGQAEAARLYEALHKARRLRPDLVYRLKRGVYVRMPALRQRREDIPLLFFHPCTGTIKDLARSAGRFLWTDENGNENSRLIQCDLEAYDELMRKDLTWPGNIRQLQSVASKIASVTWERHKVAKHGEDGWDIFVSRADVIKVLKDEFKEAFSHHSVQPK